MCVCGVQRVVRYLCIHWTLPTMLYKLQYLPSDPLGDVHCHQLTVTVIATAGEHGLVKVIELITDHRSECFKITTLVNTSISLHIPKYVHALGNILLIILSQSSIIKYVYVYISLDLREDGVYDPTIISVISLLIFLSMTYRTVFLLNFLLSQQLPNIFYFAGMC